MILLRLTWRLCSKSKEKAGEYGELASSILDCISEVMTEEDDSEIYIGRHEHFEISGVIG